MGRLRTPGAVERAALPLTAAFAGLLLVVFFYVPVATVFVEALGQAGLFVSVLTDEFYVGFLAHPGEAAGRFVVFLWTLLTNPIAAEFPDYRLGLFGFTAYQAFLSALASVALGVPMAYVLARFEFPGRETVRSLTAIPFVMPSIMVAVGFIAAFGNNGFLNGLLAWAGLPPVEWLFTLKLVILAHAFYNAPLVARITAAAWEATDARAVETARSLGARPWKAFRDVVLPQLLPAVLTGALLTFVFCFLSFAIVLSLGGYEYATIEVWVYQSVNRFDYGLAATLAAIETVFSLLLMYAYLQYEARQRASRALHPPERTRLFGAPTGRRLAAWTVCALAALVFVLPVFSMVYESLTVNVTGGEAFSLRNYAFLVERQATAAGFQVKPLTSIRNSLLFGAGCLAVSIPVGVVLAVVSTREFRGRKVIDTLAMAPFAVSGIVVGLGLLRGFVFGTVLPAPTGITVGSAAVPLLGSVPVPELLVTEFRVTVSGALAVVAAHAVGAYPFVTRNVAPMLANLDRSLVESARTLGASRTRALVDVELPLVLTGVLAGAAFAFAISVGEFDSTVILASGTEWYTMPVAIERFTGRRLGPATAMGCVLLVVTGASFVVIDRLGGRFGG
jgi:thiamine transport system permease protein